MDEPDETFESFSPWRAWLVKKRNVNLAKNHGLRVAFLKCTHVIFQNIALGKNVEEPTTDLCVESCALPPSPLPTSSIVGRSTEINPTS